MDSDIKRKRAAAAHRYRPFIKGLPYCIICDIDNTLAYTGHRDYFDIKKSHKDPVIEPVKMILDAMCEKFKDIAIFLITGRDLKHIVTTVNWLERRGIKYDSLIMRKTGDKRPDVEFKKEAFNESVEDHYNVLMVLEDRKRVCKMYRGLGLFVMQVAEGDY